MQPWVLKNFHELSVDELYAILQLRNLVFAIEQNCVYPDMDDKDQLSHHLMYWKDGKIVAYTRIIPPGIIYKEPSIGRVVTAGSVRRTGIGKELMNLSINAVKDLYGNTPIRISAQVYLQKFYTDLGFSNSGDSYLEDGIEHIEMVKS